MAATANLTLATFERIFVALQLALSMAKPGDSGSPLVQPDNVWALAVLLGERAYWWADPPAGDYRLAVQTLGPLGAENQNGPIWPLLVEAGNAPDRAAVERSAQKLAAELKKVGIGLISALATSARLKVFREAAQRIAPQPTPLPTLDSLWGPAAGESSPPAARAIDPVMRSRPAGVAARLFVYGVPLLGGVTLIAGAVRFLKNRGVHADG